MTERCKTCLSWRPLFIGEAWGVRSFMDAPAEAQAEIKGRMATIDPKYNEPMGTDAIMGVPGWDAGYGAGDDGSVPGGPEWPEWGECALTVLHNDASKKSLARAMDGSRYMAVLRCHGNFGCVQWKQFSE